MTGSSSFVAVPRWPTPQALSFETEDSSSESQRSFQRASSSDDTNEPLSRSPRELLSVTAAERPVAGMGPVSTAWLLVLAFGIGVCLGRYGAPLWHMVAVSPLRSGSADAPLRAPADMERAELHRYLQHWKFHAEDATAASQSMSGSLSVEYAAGSNDLAVERDLREIAEQRLANCRAFGPSHC